MDLWIELEGIRAIKPARKHSVSVAATNTIQQAQEWQQHKLCIASRETQVLTLDRKIPSVPPV